MMHGMTLVEVYPTGACDWLCAQCGRRFVFDAEMRKRVVLVAGDENVQHSGGRGGLRMTGVTVESQQDLDMSVWGAIDA